MAGSWAQAHSGDNGQIGVNKDKEWIGPTKFSYTFTADAADGSVPEQQFIPKGFSGHLTRVEVVMGGTAPSDGTTDLTVETTDSVDLLGGEGLDLTTTADQILSPLAGNAYAPAAFVGGIVVNVANNTTNSAQATVNLYVIMSQKG